MKHIEAERIPITCPACEAEIEVAEGQCVEGNFVRCEHCGVEAALTRELDERNDTQYWILIDPLIEYDDESR
jgi:predicted Zn finger-like uncharacterized protein